MRAGPRGSAGPGQGALRMRHQNDSTYRRAIAYLASARRARGSRIPRRKRLLDRLPLDAKSLAGFANLPLRARVADRGSDILLEVDEAIIMCEMESTAARDSAWIAERLRSIK